MLPEFTDKGLALHAIGLFQDSIDAFDRALAGGCKLP